MKIAVTGGAGFIASQIADAYINLGHDVVIIDNLSSGNIKFVNKKAAFYKTDIRDRKKIEEIICYEKPHILNHHAAQISVRNSVQNPIEDAEINIIGLLNLLEAGRKNNLKKVIFASSGGVVYGEARTLPTSEIYVPLLPLSPYGVAKLVSEYYLNFYHKLYGISYVALRYSNVYGPRQNPHGEAGVVAIFSQKLINNELPIINGDGKQTRDYVFVEDVINANIQALKKDAFGSFNIGTGIETDVNELYELIRKSLGSNIKPLHGPAKSGEQKRSCLDNYFAKEKLNWTPHFNLKLGLKKTVEYFKNHE